jgi:hypothetical protein
MTWARFDGGYAFHPKIVEGGNEVAGAHGRMITWCCEKGTDGRLSRAQAMAIAGRKKLLVRMVKLRLLDEVEGGGYQVHDFGDFNPTGEQAREQRERFQARAIRAAQARWTRQPGACSGDASVDASMHASEHPAADASEHGPSMDRACLHDARSMPVSVSVTDVVTVPGTVTQGIETAGATARDGRPTTTARPSPTYSPASWGPSDFEALWVDLVCTSPMTGPGNLADAVRWCIETAKARKQPSAAFARDVLIAYVEMLDDAAKRPNGGAGAASIAHFVRGGVGSTYCGADRALAWLDGKRPPPPDTTSTRTSAPARSPRLGSAPVGNFNGVTSGEER